MPTQPRCLVYLVDPIHNYISAHNNGMIPLGALLISAYTQSVLGNKVDIRVFKFPNLALDAIKAEPPDIIGVSNYIWNAELSKLLIRFSKERRSDTLTVMGGPNVVQTEAAMTSFLNAVPCDYYVAGAGEHSFMSIVRAWLEADNREALHTSEGIHGVWFLDRNGDAVLKPEMHVIENLDEIPSPFQNGMVDPFFQQGLRPMLETNRGCPFSCTYCVWGIGHKAYMYSIERVKADIDYCRRHSRDGLLMLNDANFGLYSDRDIEIAKFIRELKDKHDWPRTVFVNWGQVKSEDALKVAGVLRDVCMLRQSSQSLTPVVLDNIKRKNMTDKQWLAVINFCEEQGVDSVGELILMLPGETLSSYLDGLRYLFSLGIESINTNQLQLLNGAAMNTPSERAKYGMETRWRLLENCYGQYEGKVAIEAEEIVVQTNTFSREESLECRPLNWLIQMSWTERRHALLLRLLSFFGISPADFLLKAVREHNRAPAKVKDLFEAFIRDSKEELFRSREELARAFSSDEQMAALRSGSFRKLNTSYSSREQECNEDFVAYYVEIALELLKTRNGLPSDYVDQVVECSRYVFQRNISVDELEKIEVGKDVEKTVSFKYDILAWENSSSGQVLDNYIAPHGKVYRFFVEDQQRADLFRHMQRFAGMTREYQLRKLHEPVFGVKKENLLFRVWQFP